MIVYKKYIGPRLCCRFEVFLHIRMKIWTALRIIPKHCVSPTDWTNGKINFTKEHAIWTKECDSVGNLFIRVCCRVWGRFSLTGLPAKLIKYLPTTLPLILPRGVCGPFMGIGKRIFAFPPGNGNIFNREKGCGAP